MALNKLKFVFLFLSFCLVLNKDIQINNNYEEILIYKGETFNFTYQYEQSMLSDSGNYFYFKFNVSDNCQLIIKPEGEAETKMTISSNKYWHNYYVSSNTKKKYYFQILNTQTFDVRMSFIDSSKEIDLNLEKFIDLDFNTENIYNNAPNPLIFNIDATHNNKLYFKAKSGTFVSSDSLLYYCVKDEIGECSFIPLKSQFFEKGKKYKIQLNSYKYETNTLFYMFHYFTLVKEVELGFISNNEAINDRYFIVKLEKNSPIYLYGTDYEYSQITESEKQNLPDSLDSFTFENSYNEIDCFYKDKDYLIFKKRNSNSKVFFYLFQNYINVKMSSFKPSGTFEIEKEEYGLVKIYNDEKYFIKSSNKNMGLIKSSFDINDLKSIIYIENGGDKFIYINPTKKSSSFSFGAYDKDELVSFSLISDEKLKNYLSKYDSDSIFKRKIIFDYNQDFKTQYYLDIKEEYYLYIKKYYGFSNVYKYNKELNQMTDYNEFSSRVKSFYNSLDYKLINNELLIISGYQTYTLTMYYNSLLDFYIQKVEDSNQIKINQTLYPTSSFLKLLNEKKEYILQFTVDHLILLDKKFINATVTFTDSKGKTFILNNKKRIIDDLVGDNIRVISTEKALIHFYKRMPNYSNQGVIIFDKSQKNKIMKLTITNIKNNINIMLVRDFCFEGYYPMLETDSWENIYSDNNILTLYIENFYDKLTYEEDRDDEMKYIIYIFDSLDDKKVPSFHPNDYTYSDISYINNLLTPGNNYNFEVIQPNSKGSIVLNFKNSPGISYNFYMCNSKQIKFRIENSKGYFDHLEYPIEATITKNEHMIIPYYSSQILLHSFESDNEFLFFYNEDFSYAITGEGEFEFKSIIEIKENIIRLIFEGPYGEDSIKHIIIAKKDDLNNVNTFSDLCYVAKLMIKNNDSIIVKTIYGSDYGEVTLIDISKLKPIENDIFIISVIDERLFINETIKYSEPIEFKVERKEAIEIKNNEMMDLNSKKTLFKFEYIKEKEEKQKLILLVNSREHFKTILYPPESDKIQEAFEDEEISFTLNEEGVYYLEFCERYDSYFSGDTFFPFITGSIIDRIDLRKKIYYNNKNIRLKNELNPFVIKVNNITDDRYVFFTYKILDKSAKTNPYKICNDNSGECSSEIVLYKFFKNNNYTIYVNFIYSDLYGYYFFPYCSFFPIYEDTVEDKEDGLYSLNEPKLYIINFTKSENKIFYVCFKNEYKVYSFYTRDSFSLDELNSYSLSQVQSYDRFYRIGNYLGLGFVVIPEMGENPTQFIIANDLLRIEKSGNYTIPAGQATIIWLYISEYDDRLYFANNKNGNYLEENEDEINPLSFFNKVFTVSSSEKNMVLFTGNEIKEKKDFLIQNFFAYSIYVDKVSRNVELEFKKYDPKYVFFGIIDFELLKLYLQKIRTLTQGQFSMIFDTNQLQIRLYTDFVPISEFFNFYFYNMEENVILYIKQYYGMSELNEINNDLFDLNDLSNLTMPMKNSKKGQSAFNKVINFKTDKLLTGYLATNSYLDIYFEVDDNSTIINLNKMLETLYKCAGKYLKKDIEYTINFTVNHLIKLEYGENAQVSIYDGNKIIETLNKDKPTAKIKGNNLKIKSNDNALVYFYGKSITKQMEIENKEGYNIEIEVERYTTYSIDFCFEGYNPIEIFTTSFKYFRYGGTIYLENMYDKLKVKLVEGEKFIFNYNYGEPEIKYTPNLNHKNNSYTFNYIPKKSKEKTLIINNLVNEKIRYQIYFCGAPHKIQMYYQDAESYDEELLEFNDSQTVIDYKIIQYAHKLRFDSEKDFVFSYSFIDIADSQINDYKKWNDERKVMTDLTIVNVTKKYPNDNISDIFTISFKPNYINSSTRYIIVIGSNTKENSLDNFNNPCYITKLANEKPKGIKIVNVIDVGENDEIEEDIDIYEILGKTDKYIINIISQELRYEKKLNFYNAMIFTHRISDIIDDDDDNNNKNKGLSSIYIVLISLGGVLILLVVLFILFKFWRKRKINKLKDEVREIPNEKLLQEI